MPGIESSLERVVIGLPGTPTELVIYQGKIYVYDTLGQTLIDGGYISANAFSAASVAVGKLTLTNQRYVNTIEFTATDNNTCSWDAGSIIFSDGSSVNVYSGNTGNITATTYIYYNGASQVLQTSQSDSMAIGGINIPLAIVEPVTADEGLCIVLPFIAIGTTISGDKIITGRVSSANLKTYFDLSSDRIQISDTNTARVVIGKMNDDSYGVKASLPGYTADVDDNVNHYALWATSDDSVDNVLIKEKTRGSSSVDGGGGVDAVDVAHGLGYVPFVLVFYEESAGKYIKAYGWDMSDYGVSYSVDETYLTLFNETGGTKTFKYYIFYDRVAVGTYEEIYVHDNAPVSEGVSL